MEEEKWRKLYLQSINFMNISFIQRKNSLYINTDPQDVWNGAGFYNELS